MKLSGCSVVARACNCQAHRMCRRGPAGEEAASSSEGESSAEEEEVDEEALAARRAALRARSADCVCAHIP
jgi:hypothetical protein